MSQQSDMNTLVQRSGLPEGPHKDTSGEGQPKGRMEDKLPIKKNVKANTNEEGKQAGLPTHKPVTFHGQETFITQYLQANTYIGTIIGTIHQVNFT